MSCFLLQWGCVSLGQTLDSFLEVGWVRDNSGAGGACVVAGQGTKAVGRVQEAGLVIGRGAGLHDLESVDHSPPGRHP